MTGKIDKIVFLDLDHVLTNITLDNSSFLSYDPSKYRLSPVNLKYLDKILEETNACVVIASNWRKFMPPNERWLFNGKWYNSILPEFKKKYRGSIIDVLPYEHGITKSEALELWFEDNMWFSKTKDKYAILEDDLQEGYQANPFFFKHLILTDSRVGLTEKDANKAISLLS